MKLKQYMDGDTFSDNLTQWPNFENVPHEDRGSGDAVAAQARPMLMS